MIYYLIVSNLQISEIPLPYAWWIIWVSLLRAELLLDFTKYQCKVFFVKFVTLNMLMDFYGFTNSSKQKSMPFVVVKYHLMKMCN